VPGHHEIVVNADPGDEPEHLYPNVAVRDAFRKARRRLQDVIRRMEGAVKEHEPPRTGRIARFLAGTEGGFIETDDGDEVYFHGNSVIGGFGRLKVGDRVRFAEEIGEKGLQASTVRPA
jgi:cold shock CspA family protein